MGGKKKHIESKKRNTWCRPFQHGLSSTSSERHPAFSKGIETKQDSNSHPHLTSVSALSYAAEMLTPIKERVSEKILAKFLADSAEVEKLKNKCLGFVNKIKKIQLCYIAHKRSFERKVQLFAEVLFEK